MWKMARNRAARAVLADSDTQKTTLLVSHTYIRNAGWDCEALDVPQYHRRSRKHASFLPMWNACMYADEFRKLLVSKKATNRAVHKNRAIG